MKEKNKIKFENKIANSLNMKNRSDDAPFAFAVSHYIRVKSMLPSNSHIHSQTKVNLSTSQSCFS